MEETPPIRDLVRSGWERHADRVALVTASGETTYGVLRDRVLRLAQALAGLGVGANDAVCYVVSADVDVLVDIRLATYELGAALFALPPTLLTDGERLLRGVDPRAVVYDPRVVPGVPEWLKHVCSDATAIPARSTAGDYGGLLESAAARPIDGAVDMAGLAAVGFTSGTTGPPKGITATHSAAAWSTMMMQQILADIGDERGGLLIGIPLFAAGGGLVIPTLAAGSTIFAPFRFDAYEALQLIDDGQVVAAFLTPSMIIDLLDVPDLGRFDLARLRLVIYGTSIMPVPKLEEAVRRIGPVFMGGYGMAEVLPPVTVLHRAEHGTRSQPAPEEVLASVGRPVDGVLVRVVDDAGTEVATGSVGEVEVSSPAVTRGYWGDVGRTRSATRDGWWRTGDAGYLDAGRRLHILSRQADVLWYRGEPCYPRHIEEACCRHPAIKEACAVQGAPDEPVVVAVSIRSGARGTYQDGQLNAQLHGLISEHPAVTAPVRDIMVFEEIPRSVQGKVLHREVRSAVTAQGGTRTA